MQSDYWNLNTLWFALIGILWIGFFFLEGFDFGVGILARFVAPGDTDRRIALRTIGPVWDGNEVWLLVAGGATFAAFPEWYATLFSGFYLALFLVLIALIVRGVALEFRGKSADPRWRRACDEGIFWGSLLPALLFGVAFADILRGVPIDAHHEFVGTFFDLAGPYALVGGLMSLGLFTLHGAVYLSLKAGGDVRTRAAAIARRLAWPVAGLVFAFLGWTYINAVATQNTGIVPGAIPIAALGCVVAVAWLLREQREGWAFVGTGLAISLVTATIFLNLYPRVMVSSLSAANSLTIFNASSTPYTLTVMSIVAAVFTPLVLAYQAWTYWVFRQRVTRTEIEDGARYVVAAEASVDGAAGQRVG